MNKFYRETAVFLLTILAVSLPACAELFERAPDVLPGTLPEMRDPAYWIERMEKPDEVILGIDEIIARNEKFREKMRVPEPFKDVPEDRIPIPYFYPGVVLSVPDLAALSPSDVADTLKTRIGHQIDHLKSQTWGNPFAVKYADWEIDTIIAEMALDSVKERPVMKYGITVRTTRLRNVPALYPQHVGTRETGSHRWDLWNIGVLKIARPVTILHVSKTGEFLLVLSDIGYGWVRTDDIAFGDRKKIEKFVTTPSFVICTGARVQLYTDKSCTYSTGWFRMSDRLPLASKINSRIVQVPLRKISGEFTIGTAWLAPDADVHNGWLPYTRRNIVETAFKLLDKPYDWTGALLSWQHETAYRDVFACFGFELPNTDPAFTFYGSDETVILPDVGKEAQYKEILSHEPFVTLQSCGRHAQLFLGEYNGEPIVFDQHGYGYEDENGTRLEVMRCNIGTLMLPEYFLERNVTFLELK